MSIKKSADDRMKSILSKFGFCSFFIGVFFWIFIASIILDSYFFEEKFVWNTLGRILDGNAGERWITVFVVLYVFPVVTHFAGLLLGMIGLWAPSRKFAVVGLMSNAILPLLLLVNWLYRLIYGYPKPIHIL